MAIGTPVNYAKEYSSALAQKFPYVLNFGALYNTPNNGTYRWINAKTIEIPSISTTGRVNADRDSIATAQRNYSNAWETKTLSHERKWSTLVHPMDIDESGMVNTIANITQVFNDEHKFPEMDAYTVSKIYTDWITTTDPATKAVRAADTTALTVENVLSTFDKLMLKMDNERVPANGRILYCTHEVKTMLKQAQGIQRSFDVQSGQSAIDRTISRIEEVEIIGVPATLMKTGYNFTEDFEPAVEAKQINMFLVHPAAVITPVKYEFSKIDEPSAGSEGKYIYYEESHEDVFILNNKSGAIQFNITEGA